MSNNRVVWLSAGDPADAFPPVDTALVEPDGLLAAGGDLGTERLLCAYRRGIFPWYEEGQPLLWWSPRSRCVLKKGDFHLARRLRRDVRKSTAEVRFNTSFPDVIRACAAPRAAERGTWITTEMIEAYEQLHNDGWAHSVEIWQGETLAGGLYGLAIGRVLFGESMFSADSNASKIALLALSRMLDSGLFAMLDCQLVSRHLLTIGASIMSRREFVHALESLCQPPTRFENWPSAPIPVSELAQG